MKKINKIERGSLAHFIQAKYCRFSRNTLLESEDVKLIVSTIGDYRPRGKSERIGMTQYYETMVFAASWDDVYWDANTKKKISVKQDFLIDEISYKSDKLANEQHERIVAEIEQRILIGEFSSR